MRLALHLGICVICSNLVLPMTALAQSAGTNIYTCIDAAGRRLTADRPIPQCADREQRVLSPSGAERQRLGPALTEVELAERLEQRRQEQLVRQRLQDQRRRDAALLARFPERAMHDEARQAALQQTEALRSLAQKGLQELESEKLKLDAEWHSYQDDPAQAPAALRRARQDVDKAIQDQRVLLAAHAQELQRIRQRFDVDLQRLMPLWNSHSDTQSPAAKVP